MTNTGDRPIGGLRVVENAGTPADPSDDSEPTLIPATVSTSSITATGTSIATFENTRVHKMVNSPWQPRLYATVPNEDKVAVYNTDTSAFIRSVDLNDEPSGLTLSPDASKLYLAAFNESLDRGRIFVLDANDLDEISRIIVPGIPRDVRVGADGRLIVLTGSNGQDLGISHDGQFVSYAAGNGQGGYRIAKYDTLADMNVVGHFETGAFPREITYSPDDAVAYTVSQSGNIRTWNTADFESLGEFSVIGEARELSADSTGRYLYAAFDDELRVYSTGRSVAINIGDANENGFVDPGESWSHTSQSIAATGGIQMTSSATVIDLLSAEERKRRASGFHG